VKQAKQDQFDDLVRQNQCQAPKALDEEEYAHYEDMWGRWAQRCSPAWPAADPPHCCTCLWQPRRRQKDRKDALERQAIEDTAQFALAQSRQVTSRISQQEKQQERAGNSLAKPLEVSAKRKMEPPLLATLKVKKAKTDKKEKKDKKDKSEKKEKKAEKEVPAAKHAAAPVAAPAAVPAAEPAAFSLLGASYGSDSDSDWISVMRC
jgi:hypothetical protein